MRALLTDKFNSYRRIPYLSPVGREINVYARAREFSILYICEIFIIS